MCKLQYFLYIYLLSYHSCFISECKQTIALTETGEIKSPNYPLNYNINEICSYSVFAPEGKQILLTLNSFDLANKDILYVYDDEIAFGFPRLNLRGRIPVDESSSSSSSNSVADFSSLFDEPFRSTGQALVFVFLSDEIEPGAGFHATVSVIEGNDLCVKFEEKKCLHRQSGGHCGVSSGIILTNNVAAFDLYTCSEAAVGS